MPTAQTIVAIAITFYVLVNASLLPIVHINITDQRTSNVINGISNINDKIAEPIANCFSVLFIINPLLVYLHTCNYTIHSIKTLLLV